MTKYKVVEIFDSLEGEGIRTGLPATFVRLAGCNMRCGYCDTLYALYGEDGGAPEYSEMTASEIISRANAVFRRVTLTGGEPLMYPECSELINLFTERGFEINIETNGSIDISGFRKTFRHPAKVFFTIDYKLPSSGVTGRMLADNYRNLTSADIVKFVVGSHNDIPRLLEVAEMLNGFYSNPPHVFIGAVYGKIKYCELAEIILREEPLKNARLQLQIHKIIWDPQKRGV